MNKIISNLTLVLAVSSIILIPSVFYRAVSAQESSTSETNTAQQCNDNVECTDKNASPIDYSKYKTIVNVISVSIVIIAVPMIVINRRKYILYKDSDREKSIKAKEWSKYGVQGLIIVLLAQLFIYIWPLFDKSL